MGLRERERELGSCCCGRLEGCCCDDEKRSSFVEEVVASYTHFHQVPDPRTFAISSRLLSSMDPPVHSAAPGGKRLASTSTLLAHSWSGVVNLRSILRFRPQDPSNHPLSPSLFPLWNLSLSPVRHPGVNIVCRWRSRPPWVLVSEVVYGPRSMVAAGKFTDEVRINETHIKTGRGASYGIASTGYITFIRARAVSLSYPFWLLDSLTFHLHRCRCGDAGNHNSFLRNPPPEFFLAFHICCRANRGH